ncbi:MAG: hypothetical protein ACK5P6_05405 [Pseudobdellovibrionaceae bacterium]
MGIGKFVLDFLFGKDPDIFDESGNVLHKFPKKKWEAWQNRLKNDPQYNWRNHTGTQAGKKGQSQKPKA